MDKNINLPFVSVIMPVYNTESFLHASLDSILKQTYSNFEFIILNDGSTDSSAHIIQSYNDKRIVFVNNSINKGLSEIMNEGLALVHGVYIIRVDADDVSYPDRIMKQVHFMQSHPEVGIVSSWLKTIGKTSGYLKKSFLSHDELCANLLFNTSLPQPAACMRTSVLQEHGLTYDSAFKDGAEDYDFWIRASVVTRLACIPEPLVSYRIHTTNVSSVRSKQAKENTRTLREAQLLKLGITPTSEELTLHSSIVCKTENIQDFLHAQEIWLKKIDQANEKVLLYIPSALHNVLVHQWFLLCDANSHFGATVLKIDSQSAFHTSPLIRGWKNYIKYILNCLLTF